jgi:hypothetical protein
MCSPPSPSPRHLVAGVMTNGAAARRLSTVNAHLWHVFRQAGRAEPGGLAAVVHQSIEVMSWALAGGTIGLQEREGEYR